jgi:hypothetical protein
MKTKCQGSVPTVPDLNVVSEQGPHPSTLSMFMTHSSSLCSYSGVP